LRQRHSSDQGCMGAVGRSGRAHEARQSISQNGEADKGPLSSRCAPQISFVRNNIGKPGKRGDAAGMQRAGTRSPAACRSARPLTGCHVAGRARAPGGKAAPPPIARLRPQPQPGRRRRRRPPPRAHALSRSGAAMAASDGSRPRRRLPLARRRSTARMASWASGAHWLAELKSVTPMPGGGVGGWRAWRDGLGPAGRHGGAGSWVASRLPISSLP
jgi:hypothetical protein